MVVKTGTNSWQGICNEVRRRIAKGIWRPGELIPGETELAREFSCARATVNRALRSLAEAGLIDRRRKAGTRVALHRVSTATVKLPIIRQEVEARSARYGFQLIERQSITPSPALCARHGLDGDTPMLGLWTLHKADRAPFAFEQCWVNLEVVPEIATADLEAISANEWLAQHVPAPREEISFSAAIANAGEARVLDCMAGAAVFVLNRISWAADAPICGVRLCYRPGHLVEMQV